MGMKIATYIRGVDEDGQRAGFGARDFVTAFTQFRLDIAQAEVSIKRFFRCISSRPQFRQRTRDAC